MLDKKEIFDSLAQSCVFEGLSAFEIENLFFNINYRLLHYKKNEIYKYEGSEHNNADIVLQGEVMAFMIGPSGKTVFVRNLTPGSIVAPAFIFDDEDMMPVTVKANEPTIILRIPSHDYIKLIDTNEVIRHNYIRILSKIVIRLTKKIKQLNLLTTKEKVVTYLKMRVKESKNNELSIIGTRQDIADQIGVQRYSLVRCLDQLQDKGIIKVDRKKITILDKEGLMKLKNL